jgi:hypothetical protein
MTCEFLTHMSSLKCNSAFGQGSVSVDGPAVARHIKRVAGRTGN